MLIDTHCHLNFKAFNHDLNAVIERSKKAGVGKIIIPGAKIDSSQKALDIANKYPQCFAAVGIHPHHVGNIADSISLESLLRKPKLVAIGEIGMDYHHYKNYPPVSTENQNLQKKMFCQQLDLGVKYKLPAILHCRDAHDDMLNILKSYIVKDSLRGVFHCFDGKINHLKTVLDMGFYVGIDGNITYPENDRLRELVKFIPLNRLLLETDAPYLTPVPQRGNRNEPKNLKHIVEKVALLLNKTSQKITVTSSHNATKLFRL